MKLLLTGPPGIGKTTVIQRVLSQVDLRAGGFVTEEIRKHGKRVGFSVKTLDGNAGVLAHIEHKTKHKVGRYGVDIALFEGVALPSVERALQRRDIIVIDEIGKMELFSRQFREMLGRIFRRANVQVLGAIHQGEDPRITAVKKRADVEVVLVTYENRDVLPSRIAERLRDKGQPQY